MLHLLPTFLGPIAFYQFSLIGALIWGFIAFIWLGIAGALWIVHPSGWLWMVLIAGFDLIYGVICVLGGSSLGGNGPAYHYQRTGIALLPAARHKTVIRGSPIICEPNLKLTFFLRLITSRSSR